jgi:hypothetical protein
LHNRCIDIGERKPNHDRAVLASTVFNNADAVRTETAPKVDGSWHTIGRNSENKLELLWGELGRLEIFAEDAHVQSAVFHETTNGLRRQTGQAQKALRAGSPIIAPSGGLLTPTPAVGDPCCSAGRSRELRVDARHERRLEGEHTYRAHNKADCGEQANDADEQSPAKGHVVTGLST